MVWKREELSRDKCHCEAAVLCIVACGIVQVGSSDSAATDRHLSAGSLAIILLMPDPAAHERSAQLFEDDVLVCIQLNEEE